MDEQAQRFGIVTRRWVGWVQGGSGWNFVVETVNVYHLSRVNAGVSQFVREMLDVELDEVSVS